MFSHDESLIVFHGTGANFDKFDSTSMERGCETEPNNKFGIWFTGDLAVAGEYAEIAGSDPDFAGILVVEANIDPARIASQFYPLNDFVDGDIADYADNGDIVSRTFAEALANEGDGFDRGQAFGRARESLVAQGYDAMWIDTGEGGILAVFNPDVLTIRDRLSADEAESLVERLEDSGIDLGSDVKVKDFAPVYSDFLDEIGRRPRIAKRSGFRP